MRPILLLVEDNPGDAGLATEAAAWLGFDGDITWVSDGVEALAWVRSHVARGHPCPRLIVLDLNLPRLDGHGFMARLRASQACEGAAIVVFSSSSREDDRSRALAGGARRYIVKPRTWDGYVEAFSEIVDEWRAAG